jgi:hypothetical protein
MNVTVWPTWTLAELTVKLGWTGLGGGATVTVLDVDMLAPDGSVTVSWTV